MANLRTDSLRPEATFEGGLLFPLGETLAPQTPAEAGDAAPGEGSRAMPPPAGKTGAQPEAVEKGEGLGLIGAGLAPEGADTVPGDVSTTATITPGTAVSVEIDPVSDHDWYRVTLNAGTTYTIQTYQQSPASNPDSFITLRDATGTLIQEDDDSGNGTFSLISFTANVTGTYFIDAATYSGQGQSSSGVYYLAVTPNAGADVGGTIGTAAALAVGGSVNGNIDFPSDQDFYAVQLTAGQTYIFRTAGTTATTTTDTALSLLNSGGGQVATNDDAGEGPFSAIRYTPNVTGTFYLGVKGFSSSVTGAYNLTAFTTDTPTLYTNDQIAYQLTNGYWGGTSHHFNVAPGGTITVNLTGLTSAGQDLARLALAVWTDVSGIIFSEVASGGQIIYDDNDSGAVTSYRFTGGAYVGANVNIGTQWLATYGLDINSYSFQTYLHETGHALGLGHGGNYNGNADYGSDSLYLNDAWSTTVMSYFDQQENSYFASLGFTKEFIISPMVADGIAIANLYGVNTLTRTGNTTYGFNSTAGNAIYNAALYPGNSYTIFDNGGIDTLDYSGFSNNQVINLNPEIFSNVGARIGNVAIARGTVIENVVSGSGNDTVTGNDVANLINMSRGGNDVVRAGGGDDGIFFGATFTSADAVDGGTGFDQLGLQGNYGNLILAAGNLVNVEQIVLLSGSDTSFGESGANRYTYVITTNDAAVAAGQVLTVSANTLLASEAFTLDARAEADGHIVTYGGAGTETILGGQLDDGFFFGNGLWGATDRVFGGTGNFDQLAIQGNYSGGNALVFGAGQIDSIENLVLLSASDLRFGNGGTAYSYDITLNDANVTSGAFSISANTLTATETLRLNAAAESSAAITVFSGAGNDVIGMGAGNDRVFGGEGADTITGRGGADQLTGGLGNDIFAYLLASDSTLAARDHILDFTSGDRIDLTAVDGNANAAGTQAFTFIGGAAFSGAGQLHAVSAGGSDWLVEGDTNGDGTADLSILVTSDHALTIADFSGVSPQGAMVAPFAGGAGDVFADAAGHLLTAHLMDMPVAPEFA